MITADNLYVDPVPETSLLRLVASAGLRARPLNRANPLAGHWICDCPSCHTRDGICIDRGGETFVALCGCWPGSGDVFAMYKLVTDGHDG